MDLLCHCSPRRRAPAGSERLRPRDGDAGLVLALGRDDLPGQSEPLWVLLRTAASIQHLKRDKSEARGGTVPLSRFLFCPLTAEGTGAIRPCTQC